MKNADAEPSLFWGDWAGGLVLDYNAAADALDTLGGAFGLPPSDEDAL